ncbi:ChbG/HpnK family deacetylase [Neisseriaceae bacterium TC5R-5]|nr:ChbG/HpnK family deacetylase [Neisseriaceae bacterium TC5R-5]
MIKRLTLCADDFAQSSNISNGILDLLDKRRLSATSVMSQSPHWPSLATALKHFDGDADIGLHFNLTHPFDADARPLLHWLLLSQLRQLSPQSIQDSALAQIDRFCQYFGRLPDFIDGHQHVHALPIIRNALLAAIALRWPTNVAPYLRSPEQLGHTGDSRLKAIILRAVTKGFTQLANQADINTPPWFAGLCTLNTGANFAELMPIWLKKCPDQSLIMCHPGHTTTDPDDPSNATRALEYDYLTSDAFEDLCLQYEVKITRFSAEHNNS